MSVATLRDLVGQQQGSTSQCDEREPKRSLFLAGNGDADKQNNQKQELELDDSGNNHGNPRSLMDPPQTGAFRATATQRDLPVKALKVFS
jgi:hypothetical protein